MIGMPLSRRICRRNDMGIWPAGSSRPRRSLAAARAATSSLGRRNSLQHARLGSGARAAHCVACTLIGSGPAARKRVRSIDGGSTRGLHCAAQTRSRAAGHQAVPGCLPGQKSTRVARAPLTAPASHAIAVKAIACARVNGWREVTWCRACYTARCSVVSAHL